MKNNSEPKIPTPEQLKKYLPGQSKARKLPTVYRHVIKTEWYRQFTWKERLQILFGMNFVVMIGVAIQHNPGDCQPMILGKVTVETTPDEHMRGIVENMLEDQKPKTLVQPE